jgi:formylglycine-generating enzyme
MTGNVDEWVVNEKHFGPPPADGSERPFISGLKGGYWGPVRNRCRATTTFHNEWFRYYQVGFRCCGAPMQSASSP